MRDITPKRGKEGHHSKADELDRKFWVALGLYAVLAGLVWFTMGDGKTVVMGRVVEMRLVPLIVIGGLAFRTVLARQADKIRRRSEDEHSSSNV